MTSDDLDGNKGLGFPVRALAGVGYMPAKGEKGRRPRGFSMWQRRGLLRAW